MKRQGGIAAIIVASLVMACESPPSAVDDPSTPDAGIADAGVDAPSGPALPARLLYLAGGTLHLATFAADGVATSVAPISTAASEPVSDYGWSPTGEYVYYIAGAPAELFVFALDEAGASEPTRVSRPLAAGVAGVLEATFAPSSRALAYRVERVAGNADLYAVSLEPGAEPSAPVHVSVSGFITDFAWAPHSQAIAFRSPSYGQEELYVVALDGIHPILRERVSVRPPHRYNVADFLWSPDSGAVIYRADQERGTLLEGQNHLYRSFLDPWPPGEPQRLNAPLATIDDDVDEMTWSADGSWIAYRAEGSKLFLLNIAGETAQAIDVLGGLHPGGTEPLREPVFSPDSRWLAFFAREIGGATDELFAVDLTVAPLAAVRLNDALGPTQSLVASTAGCSAAPFSKDGRALIYAGDQRTAGQLEVFTIDLSGAAPGSPVVVNGPLAVGGGVTGCPVKWSADGGSIVYRGIDVAPGPNQLFLVDSATPGSARAISGPMVAGGEVTVAAWGFSPADDAIAYLADERTDEQVELFVVARGPGASPVRVSLDLGASEDVESFRWSP